MYGKRRICSVCEREIINSNGTAANSLLEPCDNCRPRPGGVIRVKYSDWGRESKGFVQPFDSKTWIEEGHRWIEENRDKLFSKKKQTHLALSRFFFFSISRTTLGKFLKISFLAAALLLVLILSMYLSFSLSDRPL